jgi:hypothetical protein
MKYFHELCKTLILIIVFFIVYKISTTVIVAMLGN